MKSLRLDHFHFIILKVRQGSEGTLEQFKARIVAGANSQVFGQDNLESYASVDLFGVVRMFLHIASSENMCMKRIDVKTAILNGVLFKAIWVLSPHGISDRLSKCYKLKKAIVVLMKAHIAWHRKLCNDLQNHNFKEIPSAPCDFVRDGAKMPFIYSTY